VRLYINSSTAHGNLTAGLRTPPPGQNALCEHPTPSGAIAETQRALLVAMDEWADQGIEPPKSNYPNGKGTLVSLDEARGAFPDIPGVDFPTVLNEYELLDFGPEFGSHGGVLTLQPPRLGPSYRLFVPKTDKDGLDIAGIRPIQIRVPLGTTTGWNIRAPGHRPPDLCRLTGSFFPFAETKGERLANGDPRKSLEERYKDHEGFVKAVRKAAKELVHERFLLQEDADSLISAAEASDVLR
jgi:Alpha/beta hydrolase domain